MQSLPRFHRSDSIKIDTIRLQFQHLLMFEKQHFCEFGIEKWMQNRTQFCDDCLQTIFASFFPNTENIVLFAVGGYGRKELFPHSDLDLFVLVRKEVLPLYKTQIEQFIQFLWDCGLKIGIAVRNLAETLTQAQQDITIATNLLERRFLCGDSAFSKELTCVLAQAETWSPVAFFDAKVAEQQKRYQRFHHTSYNLEPDLKYNLGGLRDLHLLYWLALRDTGTKNLEQLLAKNWINQEEYQQVKQSQQFLFRLRYALHLLNARPNDRLYFEHQKQLAAFLGYPENHDYPNANVETMMREYFQAAQFISVFCHIIVQHYLQKFYPKNGACLQKLDENYEKNGHFIRLITQDIYQHQPEQIWTLFHYLAHYPESEIHPDTLRQLLKFSHNAQALLSENADARAKFLPLLAQPNAISQVIVPLHRYGILKNYLPNWQKITGLMQFDLFHSYTVDEHIIRVLQTLEQLEEANNSVDFPLATQLFNEIKANPITLQTLYLAALFHDIAKGRGGDHSELALKDVEDFCQLHGIPREEQEDIAWLVQHHLTMSITAQRRDIQDPHVIQAFAAKVKTPQRLKLLLCLTVADIYGTDEKRWNPWKASLLSTLYENTLAQLQHGCVAPYDSEHHAQQQREQAEQALLQAGIGEGQIQALWATFPEAYFLRTECEQIVQHSQWLIQNFHAVCVKVYQQAQGTEVFIYCPDQAALFYKVVAVLEKKKIDIHQAQIMTCDNGYALDSFIISEKHNMHVAEDRCLQIEKALTTVLMADTLPMIGPQKTKIQPFDVPTAIRFIRTPKDQTQFELTTLDKQGLLARVGKVFYELALNLHSAKISTIGEKAQDFFIVTNREGHALNFSEKQQLRAALVSELS